MPRSYMKSALQQDDGSFSLPSHIQKALMLFTL